MANITWRRALSSDRNHRLGAQAQSIPGLWAAAAAIAYRETGDPFAGTVQPEPRARAAGSALMLRKDRAGEKLYAARGYRAGERVLELDEVEWRPERDRETVEHPFGGHLYHPVLAKAAHACAPNCRIDFAGRALLASKPIAPGDLITIDYQSTDRRITRPFDCHCGAPRCRGRIG